MRGKYQRWRLLTTEVRQDEVIGIHPFSTQATEIYLFGVKFDSLFKKSLNMVIIGCETLFACEVYLLGCSRTTFSLITYSTSTIKNVDVNT